MPGNRGINTSSGGGRVIEFLFPSDVWDLLVLRTRLWEVLLEKPIHKYRLFTNGCRKDDLQGSSIAEIKGLMNIARSAPNSA